jgi:DNA polymerase III delta prime subunit
VILRTPDRPDCTLPAGTNISNVFERVGRSLLILGEPGAGKTTTLLELAREMIDRAEKDPSEKIPVVFNLSSWTDPKQSLNEWMAEEMRDNYRIQKKIAETWIENDSILPLLDGLDEIANERRAACVDVINGYLDEYSAQAVICCRKEEYEALDAKLKLQSAILLQPLTPEQIDGYLERLSPDLNALREALRSDQELQEFAKTPLILSIMALAYKGISVKELQSLGSTEDWRRHLFKIYVDQMFQRTGRTDSKRYPKVKTIHWLSWLARKMRENNHTVFLVERMQPSWLETKGFQRLSSILMQEKNEINTVEVLDWSWNKGRGKLMSRLVIGLIIGLIVWLINFQNLRTIGYGVSLIYLLGGLVFGLSIGLVGVLIDGLVVAEMETRTVPNQGILRSAKNALVVGLIVGLIVVLIGGLIAWLISGQISGQIVMLTFGLGVGFGAWLDFGGRAVVHHYTLRFVLSREGLLPWNLVPFLDYATERIFLRKVGGGYVFVHRMLMEYFADLEPGPGSK